MLCQQIVVHFFCFFLYFGFLYHGVPLYSDNKIPRKGRRNPFQISASILLVPGSEDIPNSIDPVLVVRGKKNDVVCVSDSCLNS